MVLQGRWAGQGEWSEGRTSEEESAPDLEVAAQGAAPVEVQGVSDSYRQSSQTEERFHGGHQASPFECGFTIPCDDSGPVHTWGDARASDPRASGACASTS